MILRNEAFFFQEEDGIRDDCDWSSDVCSSDLLMTASEIERTLVRLAHEMVEKTEGLPELVLVGIRRRGVHLAERLARKIREISSAAVPVGTLDIQFYRDDLSKVDTKPVVIPTQIPFPVSDKDVILVDDVLYTGRTSRAAMDALFDHGRPQRVRLCVLRSEEHTSELQSH